MTVARPLRRASLLLLALLPAVASCGGDSDNATALDLVIEPRVTIDQIDIRSVTLDGQAVTLDEHLLPHQRTPLHNGDVLRLLFDDDQGGRQVVVTAVGLLGGNELTGPATATGTLQTKHPLRAALVLGTSGTGGSGGGSGGKGGGGGSSAGGGGTTSGAGGVGPGGSAGGAGGGGGSSAGAAGATGTAGASGSGVAGRGGASGTLGTGGASGSSGGAAAAGRGGSTGGGGRGGGAAGTSGAAGRGGAGGGGTSGAAGQGGGTSARGGTGGSTGNGGAGGAPRCATLAGGAQTVAGQLPAGLPTNPTDCGFVFMNGVVTYAPVNGSRFALLRDLEFGQGAACGRCIEVTAQGTTRNTVVMVVGQCPVVGVCATDTALALSSVAYGDIMTGTPTSVTWRYVACPTQGPVFARLDATMTRVVILNHLYGIARVESQDTTGSWLTLSRLPDNFWNYVPAITLAGRPLRVTDINGGVVTGNLAASTGDQTLGTQLPMCVP